MAEIIVNSNAEVKQISYPAKKAKRYRSELMKRSAYVKKSQKLTKSQVAYRRGYLAARRDIASLYQKKN